MDERYRDYLQSDWWKRTRDQILEGAGYKCECCGKPYDLQIHHLTYIHLGFERDYELMCLCKNCHSWIEQKKAENSNNLSPSEQRDYLRQRKDSIYAHEEYTVKKRSEIYAEFIREYKNRDYSALGDLNLTNLDVMKKEYKAFSNRKGYDPEMSCPCTAIQNYFRNRRYEVILRFKDNGADPTDVINQTKISQKMVYDIWRNPQKANNALIKEREEN